MLWNDEEAEGAYGIVYKATNIVNNKCYVGITRNGMLHRKQQHITSASRHSNKGKFYFHRAIAKYGADAFEWEVIAKASSTIELHELEKEWIWLNKSDDSNYGYNRTVGGEGPQSEEALQELRERAKTQEYKDQTSIGTKIGFAKMSESAKASMLLHRKETYIRLFAEGNHPCAQIVTCPYCGITGKRIGLLGKHFSACPHNPANADLVAAKLRKQQQHIKFIADKNKLKIICPHCHRAVKYSTRHTHHFDNCSLNPTSIYFSNAKHRRYTGLSQLESTCPYCGFIGKGGNMKKYHFEQCKCHPNNVGMQRHLSKETLDILHAKWRSIATCPHCGKTDKWISLNVHHFDHCKKNPNYVAKPKVILTCPHCGLQGGPSNLHRAHFDHCKKHPNNIGKPLSEKAQRTLNRRLQIVTCPHCSKTGKYVQLKYTHFDKCIENPDNTELKIAKNIEKATRKKYDKRKLESTCPHCGKVGYGNNMFRYHFDYCVSNPNRAIRVLSEKAMLKADMRRQNNEKIVTCPYCHKSGMYAGMKVWHFDNCKKRPQEV